MKIHCRTNLDNLSGERWPENLPVVPRQGDLIQSALKWGECRVELEVIRVTWKFDDLQLEWYASVELHLPKHRFHNILHFENWLKLIKGKITDEEYRLRMETL